MALNTMQDLFVEQLKDLYSAETQIIEALPKMKAAASSPDLKQAFEDHLQQTKEQKQRLEQILTMAKEDGSGHKCKAMEGLIKEGSETIAEDGDPSVKDAALIAAAQRIEHYEISAYGSTRTYAEHLGHSKAVDLLQTTLDEEGDTDKKLTSLAEGSLLGGRGINAKADDAG